MCALLTYLHAALDADAAAIPLDDYLSAVAVLHAADVLDAASHAPKTLTLDALATVAWQHGIKFEFTFTPRAQ